jgi:hypothetical protein
MLPLVSDLQVSPGLGGSSSNTSMLMPESALPIGRGSKEAAAKEPGLGVIVSVSFHMLGVKNAVRPGG